ncbi:pyrroloquinoline quinone biosynthesis peptide chaperone PqqD [Prosthecomicrobium hirschii]|nr:pyrroloquinoline quinone biosynthesis peptide chaperone PqqD [Prosthecomicrobium hirschii]
MKADAATDEAVPRLPRGVKLRFDQVRNSWMLLAPERAFQIDETAAEILKRCDGQRTLATVIAETAAAYNEEPSVIDADIRAMLVDLANKRVLEL